MTKAPLLEAAARAGVSIFPAFLNPKLDSSAFEQVFDLMERDRVDGLMVGETSEQLRYRESIVELATKHRLPTIYPYRDYVEAGGLLSFGIYLADVFRRMADMTADILSGVKPADIPYYQQTKFELVLNRKAAKSLGLDFPTSVLVAADEVIE